MDGDQCLQAAKQLHGLLASRFWNGAELLGPDPGKRFNRRLWRFVRSYSKFLPWNDSYYYLQAQGYWAISSWHLCDLADVQSAADIATACARGIARRQAPEGYWNYPSSVWAGRISTVEGTWAALGLLASYERAGVEELREGALDWYEFLVNHTGFQRADVGMGINYFSNARRGLVPNNSTVVLAFLGELARVLEEEGYLKFCPEMISFLASVQRQSGELPYEIATPLGKERIHYQCNQYNAFQLLDLAIYYQATKDASALPLIHGIQAFLAAGVNADGSTRYACDDNRIRITYHTCAVAAALCVARRLGGADTLDAEDRAYRYVLSNQREDGGFPFSRGDYYVLQDTRYYPRYLAMILQHLLIKAEPEGKGQ